MGGESNLLSYSIVPAGIVDQKAASVVLQQALDQTGLTPGSVDDMVATGYGRTLVSFSDKNITEISCHTLGAY